MSISLIPELGAIGTFTLSSPFNTLISSTARLECKSIRKISELLAVSENVYIKYYKKNNISEQDYEKDRLADVCILGLMAENGKWFYVPNSYLLAYPNLSGVPYSKIILGVSLGAIPHSLNLDPLKELISDTVLNVLGINPQIELVAASQTALLDYDDHDKIENARKAKITIDKPTELRLAEMTRLRDQAVAKVTMLEKYIKKLRNL